MHIDISHLDQSFDRTTKLNSLTKLEILLHWFREWLQDASLDEVHRVVRKHITFDGAIGFADIFALKESYDDVVWMLCPSDVIFYAICEKRKCRLCYTNVNWTKDGVSSATKCYENGHHYCPK